MRQLPSTPTQTQFISFNGGLDVVTPPLLIPPGYCREAQNYEQDINGGYTRITGYERFSGQAKPSDAAYGVLTCTITGSVSLGDVLTDAAGTSYGTVIALPTGQAVMTLFTGTFTTGDIKVGGVTVGTCTGGQVIDGASTALLHAQYKNLAADVYRALIATVPGSGSILGVWMFNDVVYAFRNNAGATAVDMYKSTTGGWSLVALGRQVSFTSGGTYTIAEGDTITGATSAATAVITRVVLTSGTWAAGTAAGKLIFASQTGTFQAENLNVGANLNVATIAGDSSAITMGTVGGRFEFVNANFGGAANTTRVYGCDGKNKGFEWDGTVFVPIDTGMTTDAPSHVVVHHNQLFFSFVGSVQHSSPGSPYVWSAITGASELAMGDTVTGFMVQPGSTSSATLSIFTRNSSAVLYGTGVASWVLVAYKQEAGAIAWSIQRIGNTIMLDDRGLVDMRTAQEYGNFIDATFSERIQTWLNTRRTTVTASCVSRDKSQYRLFFSDKSALYVTFKNTKVLGMMPQFFTDQVTCAYSGEMNDVSESSFFGSTDGFVYEMEKGTSFDGDAIEAKLHMVFNHAGSPRLLKGFQSAMFEISGEGYAAFGVSYDLGYGSTSYEQGASTTINAALRPAYWDSFTWDAFTWDGTNLLPQEMSLAGTAENISIKILSNEDYYAPTHLTGVILHFKPRRQLR